MDRRTVTLVMIGAAVGAGLLVAQARGRLPTVSLPERAVAQSWSPYAYWMHQSPGAYIHHFPSEVGTNCLPLVYQTEDIGQALDHVEVSGAGCAQ